MEPEELLKQAKQKEMEKVVEEVQLRELVSQVEL